MGNTVSAQQAVARLRAGNDRFVAAVAGEQILPAALAPGRLPDVQAPFATILGCSDARVPAEIVFDQGLGDLFVIRVAGNVVAPSQIGSVEFAAEQFNTPLVVVLGHSNCGAIAATLDALRNPETEHSRNLSAIVDRIKPALHDLVELNDELDEPMLLRRCVQANIRASVARLLSGSSILEQRVADGLLHVVGAQYDLRTGVVSFLGDTLGRVGPSANAL